MHTSNKNRKTDRPASLPRRIRRWRRRLYRRHPWARRAINAAIAAACLLAVLVVAVHLLFSGMPRRDAQPAPQV